MALKNYQKLLQIQTHRIGIQLRVRVPTDDKSEKIYFFDENRLKLSRENIRLLKISNCKK